MKRFGQRYILRESDPAAAGGLDPIVIADPPADPYEGMNAGDVIPDEFKGRDPAEVKLLMSQMPRIVKAQKEELDNLRVQMAGGGAPTVTHGPPVVQKTADEVKAEFETLFDENPREAIRQFVVGEFGDRFGQVESRLGDTDLTLIKQANPDFGEFEEDVKTLLTRSGTPATQQNIMGAYAMAVGNRELARKAQIQRAGDNPIPATPAPDPATVATTLTPLQDEVRESMGLSAEEFQKYSGDDSFDLKIRT